MKTWFVEFGLGGGLWEYLKVYAEDAAAAAIIATPDMDRIMLEKYNAWMYEIKTPSEMDILNE